ncbi:MULTISPECIES: hypothetical protein [Nocardiaceae]|uniref:Uncharacterized protein n=1 Tax=Rhodococcoides corynebacterioides TaxID=53972 RepID=A0ABS2KV62_9NOCA|nr:MULTISPECIES: hypothetical protein [Rhodococcus]MBM7415505.1 hypothetical protein [Rhodococcus corynebacterioides]MBP1117967.1 hypothetical protein [Rhodococcus sp. PvP016]
MYAFDDSAEPGLMRLSMHDSDLLFLAGDGIRSWFHMRAGADHMTARWERSDGNNWTTWMAMRFDRLE